MIIRCLGGFQEVGRNAVLLESGKERLLFDYGVKVETGEVPPATNADNILLSHAHLDHSGNIPALFKRFCCPVYSTAASFEQAHLLLKDSIKVAKLKNFPVRFSESDIKTMQHHEVRVTYGQQFELGNALVDVYDAGHVPGSASFLIEVEGKKIVYTGDFKLSATNLLNGARFNFDCDVAIMENTYSYKEHPPRQQIEKQLIEIINDTISNDGIALLPCFAVGRAAELLMLLDRYRISSRIFLDGMAKEATEIALHYPELLRDHKALQKALEDVVPLYTAEDRRMALKRPSVIITTAGMLSGGPVIHYLKKLYSRKECSLVFTGFQVPDTPGRRLFDTGWYRENDLNLKVNMGIHYLDLSAHAGRSELLDFIKKTAPEKIILMHGDRCEEFAKELQQQGLDAVAPENGDTVEI